MKRTVSNKEYDSMVKKASPNSRIVSDCVKSFVIGGIICVIGEIISQSLSSAGMNKTDTAAITSSSLIFIGALLTAVGLYDDIAKIGKAGTLVPITGFANSIVSPAVEYKTEGLVLGVGAKMFTIAGPVLVFGVSASVIYAIIYYFVGGGM